MNRFFCLLLCLCLSLYTLGGKAFERFMANRPVQVKLGYVPKASVVRYIVADQILTVAATYTMRSIIYYGDLVQQWRMGNKQNAEMDNLLHFLESSVALDPYNMDTLYFLQAAFTWDVDRAEDVNRLLDHAMQKRDWDWLLPYYAGFNAGFFLHDYDRAANYMKRAAKLSGHPLLSTLASRYMFNEGKTGAAIAFLEDMIRHSRDKNLTASLVTRRQAFLAIHEIEKAVRCYRHRYETLPSSLNALIATGCLESLPEDPYGGKFYIDSNGAVFTSSRLTFSKREKAQ